MSTSAPSLHTTMMHGYIDRLRSPDREVARAAGSELIRSTKGRFDRLARRMFRGYRNVLVVAELDDVVWDGWVRFLHTLNAVRPADTRGFYILAAVHINRVLLDLARRATRPTYQTVSLNTRDSDSSSGGPVPEPAAPATDPDDIELWSLFHEAVTNLEPVKLEIFNLGFYHGRTQADIAAMLGCSEKRVSRKWTKALLELKAMIGGKFPNNHADE